jgi:cysteinyl-tRNA synthetase
VAAQRRLEEGRQPKLPEADAPPPEVLALVEARQAARTRKDWAASDAVRQQIAGLGWQVLDTPEGPRVERGG